MRLFPYLDFVTIRTQYTANYNWAAGSLNSIDSLGSVISNGQTISLTNEFNFTTLYGKSKFLKNIQEKEFLPEDSDLQTNLVKMQNPRRPKKVQKIKKRNLKS